MARPVSPAEAACKTVALLVHRLPGPRGTTVQGHLGRARLVGEALYRQWRVGPYQWRLKHLRHYLEHRTARLEPATRYRYWLTVRLLVLALKREAWLGRLKGPWERPAGSDGTPVQGGRPLKRPT